MYRLTGQYSEAETRLNQALEIFQQTDSRWQVGRTLCEMGELAVEEANATGAREYFSQALNVFESIDAAPDVERTRDRMKLM